MTKRFIKIAIKGTGGEYTFGKVSEQKETDIIQKKIDEGEEIGSTIYYQDENGEDKQFNHYDYDDILHQFGPEINDSEIIVTEFDSEKLDNEIDEIINVSLGDSGVTTCLQCEPGIEFDKKSNVLYWGNEKIEKRIYFPATLILEDNTDFHIENIFLPFMSMQEAINNSDILTKILYIPKNEQIEIAQAYFLQLEKGVTSEDMKNLSSIVGEAYFESKDIDFSKYELNLQDVEGKGEIENDFSVIRNSSDEIIYEGSAY